jgi:hypothetical protein
MTRKSVKETLKTLIDDAGIELKDYSWLDKLASYVMCPASYDNGSSPGYRDEYQKELMELWEAAAIVSAAEPQERDKYMRAFEKIVAQIMRKKRCSGGCYGDENEHELVLYPNGVEPPEGPNSLHRPNI